VKLILLGLTLLLAGCATSANLFEKRRAERAVAYNALSPELKAAVDQGEIKVGMPEDAVYIAWGPPAQILRSGSAQGEMTRWLYTGSYMEEYRYWTGSRGRGFPSAQLQYDYVPRDYVSAEVVFSNGVVKSWSMKPQPY
jgi:hypothetical protein